MAKNAKKCKKWQKVTQLSSQKWFLNFQNFYASESCVRLNFVFFTAPVGGSIEHPNILHSPICGAGSEYSASQDWTAVQVVSSFGTGNWILCLVLEGWFYFPCDCSSRPSLSLRFTDWKIVRWQRLLVVLSRNRLSPIDSLGLECGNASSSDCRKEQLSGWSCQ